MEATLNNAYTNFLHDALGIIPQERIYTDELRRLAWGTDAGFYRLIPHIVIRSKDEDEVSQLLRLATRHKLPVTRTNHPAARTHRAARQRAAGTLRTQVRSRPGVGEECNGGRHRDEQRLGHELRHARQQRQDDALRTHRPGGRHRAGHGRPRQPRIVRGDPPRLPATSMRPARRHPRRRRTGRTHPLQIRHQERHGTQPAAVRALRRPLRHHRAPDGGQRRHPRLPLAGDDEDRIRLSLQSRTTAASGW